MTRLPILPMTDESGFILPVEEQRQVLLAMLGTFKRLMRNQRAAEALHLLRLAIVYAVWWRSGVLPDKYAVDLEKIAQTLRTRGQIGQRAFNRLRKLHNVVENGSGMSLSQLEDVYQAALALVPEAEEVSA